MNSPKQLLSYLQGMPYLVWVMMGTALSWGIFGAMLGATTPNLRADLDISFEAMGTLMAVWTVGSAVGSLLGGEIANRFAPRPLLLTYMLLTIGSLLLIVTAQSYTQLLIGFPLVAIFETAIFTLGHGLLAQMSADTEKRTRILSLIDVGYSAGTLLSPFLVTLVFFFSEQWRLPYFAFLFAVLVLLACFYPRSAYTNTHQVVAETVAENGSYWQLLQSPVVRWTLISGICCGFTEVAQYFWSVSFASQGLGLSEAAARMVFAWMMAGMVIGRLWQAFWVTSVSMFRKLLLSALLSAVATTAYAYSPAGSSFLWLALCNLGIGLGLSVAFPILLGSCIHVYPNQASRLSAMLMLAVTLGAQGAALLIGTLSDHHGIQLAFQTTALLAVAYLLSVVILLRTLRKHEAMDHMAKSENG